MYFVGPSQTAKYDSQVNNRAKYDSVQNQSLPKYMPLKNKSTVNQIFYLLLLIIIITRTINKLQLHI